MYYEFYSLERLFTGSILSLNEERI